MRQLPEAAAAPVEVRLDGEPVSVPAGVSVAAALLLLDRPACRLSPVSGAPRAPYCLMGVCLECLVTIDGRPGRFGCLTPVADGMRIDTGIAPDEAGEPAP